MLGITFLRVWPPLSFLNVGRVPPQNRDCEGTWDAFEDYGRGEMSGEQP